MDDSSSYYIVLLFSLLGLLCFSAFFSASETAYTSLNRFKLKNLAVKIRRARLALKILDAYDKLLSTVLIGNNIVNIAASALATALFINLFGGKGVSLATLVMTLLLLIFSEISPKTLAKESPELTALRNAPLLRFFMIILLPLNILASAWRKIIIKIFPAKQDRSTTDNEILTYMEEVRQEGAINSDEEQMIRHVIEFDDRKVSGILTPRIDVEAVSDTSSVEEIDRKFIESGFSRLPVYKDTIDNITGIILLKDFYHEVMRGIKTPAQIIKPVVYITKTIKNIKLLRTLQKKKAHMAVVVDEHGGTIGIVTIEDIIEELVGEIWDEHDEVVEPVKKMFDNNYLVFGNVNFQDMLEAINMLEVVGITVKDDVKDDDEIPDTTIANWCMETFGRLPQVGEELTWNNLTIRVTRVVKQRIMEVRVTTLS